jgi:hypothetical protein
MSRLAHGDGKNARFELGRHMNGFLTGLQTRAGSLQCTENSEALRPSHCEFLLGALSRLWELCKSDTIGSCAMVCKH